MKSYTAICPNCKKHWKVIRGHLFYKDARENRKKTGKMLKRRCNDCYDKDNDRMHGWFTTSFHLNSVKGDILRHKVRKIGKWSSWANRELDC